MEREDIVLHKKPFTTIYYAFMEIIYMIYESLLLYVYSLLTEFAYLKDFQLEEAQVFGRIGGRSELSNLLRLRHTGSSSSSH